MAPPPQCLAIKLSHSVKYSSAYVRLKPAPRVVLSVRDVATIVGAYTYNIGRVSHRLALKQRWHAAVLGKVNGVSQYIYLGPQYS